MKTEKEISEVGNVKTIVLDFTEVSAPTIVFNGNGWCGKDVSHALNLLKRGYLQYKRDLIRKGGVK